jgi:hypothetical protein
MFPCQRVYRTIFDRNLEKHSTIDFAQAWKMHDGSSKDRSYIFYSAPKDFRKSGGNQRIWWVETDEGPFVLETKDDMEWVSAKSGISLNFLENLIKKTTSDMVFSK